jgi:hypothetical protein
MRASASAARRVDRRLRLRPLPRLELLDLEELGALVDLDRRRAGRQRRGELGELGGHLAVVRNHRRVHVRLHLGERLARAAVVGEQLVAARAQDDLVINVGDVELVLDVVAERVLHHAAEYVKRQVCTRVAHVRHVVHGRPACVPAHAPAARGHKRLLRSRERVVDDEADRRARVRVRRWVPRGHVAAAHRRAKRARRLADRLAQLGRIYGGHIGIRNAPTLFENCKTTLPLCQRLRRLAF